ncbi:MAG: DNA replication complex GINS family protein [Desulfurococcales archaeon]|nr:DNA replication complex GINS family protein [Desulfurococcales archaeon]
MSDIRDRLRLLERDYELEPVRVLVLKEAEVPTPSGVVVIQRGEELDLPRWQARKLRDNGVVEIKEAEIGAEEIARVHFTEVHSRGAIQLAQLPPRFYLKVREYIESLNKAIKENPSPSLFNDRANTEKLLADIVDRRLNKIVRLVVAGGDDSVLDKMTPEEKILYKTLLEILKTWREGIIGYLGR